MAYSPSLSKVHAPVGVGHADALPLEIMPNANTAAHKPQTR